MQKVSIIVPIFNSIENVQRALESIKQQTYANLEIIMVDDGSTDGSSRVCESFQEKDERFVFIKKENGGVADARNVGIAAATGSVIMFVDSDDYIEKEAVSIAINTMEKESADLVIFGFKRIYKDKTIATKIENKEITKEEALQELCLDEKITSHLWNKAYKKELFADLSMVKGKIYEDIYIMHSIIDRCSKIIGIDKILYSYCRTNKKSISTGCNQKQLEDYEFAINSRKEYVKKKQPIIYSKIEEKVNFLIVNKNFEYLIFSIIHKNEITEKSRQFVIEHKNLLFKYRKNIKTKLQYWLIKKNSNVLNNIVLFFYNKEEK